MTKKRVQESQAEKWMEKSLQEGTQQKSPPVQGLWIHKRSRCKPPSLILDFSPSSSNRMQEMCCNVGSWRTILKRVEAKPGLGQENLDDTHSLAPGAALLVRASTACSSCFVSPTPSPSKEPFLPPPAQTRLFTAQIPLLDGTRMTTLVCPSAHG